MELGTKPAILVAAGNWWPLSARMAIALNRAGCSVAAVCPPRHPLRYTSCLTGIFPLRQFRPRASLRAAIEFFAPDLIVPCDDRTVYQLHDLHARHPRLRVLIERSLGDPAGFSVTASRERLRSMAAAEDIDVPAGCEVESIAQAQEAFARFAPVAVMKLDGTYGGDGVQIVGTRSEGAAAFRRLRSSLGLGTALKRSLVNQDTSALWMWGRREAARLTMQQFVPGIPANIMVACWRGEVLGHVSVEVVSSQGPTGAANVVRLVEYPQFLRAAQRLAAVLGMSGFFGLDFVVDHRSGRMSLVEMNPRCTQLGHLQLPGQGDLAGILCERLTGCSRRLPDRPISAPEIAFFPQAWRWSGDGQPPSNAFQDIPWEDSQLVEALKREPWRDTGVLGDIYHRLRKRRTAGAAEHSPPPASIRGMTCSPVDWRRRSEEG